MAIIQIPNLPAVIGLDGSELFEGVQAGTSVKISLGQMIAAIRTGLPTTLPLPISDGGTGATTAAAARTNLGLGTMATQNANAVAITGGTAALTGVSSVTVSSASAALTVTQTGAGNAFFVEDSASPDSTPFAINADGEVGIGKQPTSTVSLDIGGVVSPQVRLLSTTNAVDLRLQSSGGSSTAIVGTLSNHPLAIFANSAERMRIDASGNVGIGVTPGAWGVAARALQLQYGASLVGLSGGYTLVRQNALAVAGADNYISNGFASDYYQLDGQHIWRTAPSGTAGNAITFSERFRFGASGQFGIGGANYGTSGQTIISAGSGAAPAWGAVGAAGGGTGITSYTIGDIIYASGTTTLSKLADVATGNALISGGVGVAPSYGKIGLTTHVSGTLPVASGGTGVTTAPAAAAVLLGYTSTATAAGTTVLTNASSQYQLFTGSTTQTITLPVTSTLGTGWSFHIVNNSTGSLTVNSSGGNLVATIIAGLSAMITCIGTTLTTAADWEAGFTDFQSLTGTGAVVLGTGPTITAGALNGTVGATTPSTGAFTTVTASTSVLSTGAGGIGYATGAGVAVTQLSSRTTAAPTTGAKTSGAVTLFTTTAVVGTYFSFTVPNTAIAITDTVVVTVRGATNTYVAFVTAIVAATSFQITMASVAGTASDTPIVNFTIIKGVSA
jgi:hypothetical protein